MGGREGGPSFTFIARAKSEGRRARPPPSSCIVLSKKFDLAAKVSQRVAPTHPRLYIDQVRARGNFSFFPAPFCPFLSLSLVPSRHWLNVSCLRDTRHKYRDITKCICTAKYPGCLSDKRWIILYGNDAEDLPYVHDFPIFVFPPYLWRLFLMSEIFFGDAISRRNCESYNAKLLSTVEVDGLRLPVCVRHVYLLRNSYTILLFLWIFSIVIIIPAFRAYRTKHQCLFIPRRLMTHSEKSRIYKNKYLHEMSVIALVALMERYKIVAGLTADVFWLGKYQSFIQINSPVNLANNVPLHSESLAEIVPIWNGLNFPCGSYVETTRGSHRPLDTITIGPDVNPRFHVCIVDNKPRKRGLRFDKKRSTARAFRLLQLFFF